ncbi:MAG: bifunctional riboflavin kinase/FAD synthetase [Lachnospiraceae bacterium]|nr:bifunctional riboflavin kinase/FAD synthetase [Lachnospiraceae bacterium]
MEIISESVDFQLNRETAIAIGKFDGVHVGHRRLLEEILEKKKDGFEACVFTFDVSPAVLFGFGDGKVLSTREEKRRIFKELGIDVLVEFPMTHQTAAIPAEDFARRYLSGALCGRFIAAGDDLSFGQYGKGDAKLLQSLSSELEFEVKTISKVEIEGIPASSTYVRSLVEAGKMEEASTFLGEPYCIDGTVVHGRHLGHELGFPTINILPQEDKLLPPFGVYASKVRIDGKLYCGITNIGRKPTVDGNAGLTGVETNLFDFDGDLYGREVQVYLHHFQRPERKFENVDALKRQIALDVEKCKELLE